MQDDAYDRSAHARFDAEQRERERAWESQVADGADYGAAPSPDAPIVLDPLMDIDPYTGEPEPLYLLRAMRQAGMVHDELPRRTIEQANRRARDAARSLVGRIQRPTRT